MNTKTLTYQGDTWELSRSHISLGVTKVAEKATYDLCRFSLVEGTRKRIESFSGYSEDRALNFLQNLWGSRATARIVMDSFNESNSEAKPVRSTQPRPTISGLPRSLSQAIAHA